jgi:hypothetical protein
MKEKIVALIAIIVLILSVGMCSADQEQMIRQRYSDSLKQESTLESWRNGLQEMNLTLDHLTVTYEKVQEITSENKYVICGAVTITGYAKTQDGLKKRVLLKKNVCHLFVDDQLVEAAVMSISQPELLNGWNNQEI